MKARIHSLFIVVASFVAGTTNTQAATQYWNPSPLSDNWANAVWSATSGGGSLTAWTASNNAIFDQAGTYSVTINAAQTAANLNIKAGTVSFAGTNTVSSTAITIDSGASLSGPADRYLKVGTTTLTVNGTLDYSGPTSASTQKVSVAGGTGSMILNTGMSLYGAFTFAGNISGAGSPVTNAAGVIDLSGNNTYGGDTLVRSGNTLRLGSSTALSSSSYLRMAGGNSIIELTGTNFSRTLSLTTSGANVRIGNTADAGSTTSFGFAAVNADRTVALNGTTTWNSTGSSTFNPGILTLGTTASTHKVTLTTGIDLNAATRTINTDNGSAAVEAEISGVLSGATGSLTKTGAGVLLLSNANTYAGNTTISGGSLQLGNGSTNGKLSISSSITNNANLTINRSNAVVQGTDFSTAAITGSGSFTQAGPGTTTLNAANAYLGGTNANGGTLLWSGANNLPGTGTLQVNAGGTFSLGDGTARNTSTAALNLASGACLAFDWNGAGLDNLTSTAAATTTGNVGIIIQNITPSGSGGPLISSASGGLTTTNGTKYFLANNTNFTAGLTVSDTAVSIGSQTVASPLTTNAYWKGGQLTGALGAMALSSGTTSNWASTASGTAAGGVVPGGSAVTVIFGASGSAQQANVTTGADMNLASITFNDSAAVTIGGSNAITLNSTSATAASTTAALATVTAGSAISVTSFANATNTINANVVLGASQTWDVASAKTLKVNGTISNTSAFSLTKQGAGTLQLANAGTFSGGTLIGVSTGIAGGILAVTHAQGLGTGAITINGSNSTVGTLQLSNDIAITTAGAVSLTYSRNAITAGGAAHIQNLSGTNSISSNISLATTASGGTGANILSTAGTLTLNGNLTNANSSVRAFTFSGAGDTSVRGNVLTGGGGIIVQKEGIGTLTLAGTGNTYGGGTVLNQGTLTASAANSLGATAGTLTVGNTNTGAGTNTVLNLSTSADITVGTLSTPAGVLSTPSSGTNTATINTQSARNFTVNQTAAGTYAGVIAGAGSFTLGSLSTNTLTLSGANTYSGGTTVNQGTLTVGTGGTLGATTGALAVNNTNTAAGTAAVLNLATAVDTTVGTLSGSIATPSSGTNSATINTQTARNFTVNQTAAGTYAGVIAGAGSVTLGSLSTNTLTFTGANTYSGGTIINQGTLTVGTGGTGGTLGATSGALAVNNTNTSAGTAAVLNLATAADTTVGTLSGSIATPSSGTNTATINTQAAQNFTVNQTAAGTYAGVIAGAGSFTLGSLSTNTLTLSGPNTYSGNTVISNGTLATGVAAAIPFGAAKGDVILDGGGTSAGVLDLAGLNISINGLSGLTGVVLGKVVNNISASAAVLSVGNNDATSSFAGILANNSSGTGTLGLIKTGSGTLTLSGANTYTDATSVTAGTLALVGGSQTSPITVNSGAALGFTLGSPTTSTSTVTFSGATAKVTVAGTPAAATLMTASNISGTPVLDPAIPGYELAIESGGTQLNLKASAPANPFNTWATTTNGLSGANAAAGADPDNDGIKNAIEFVIGGQPNPANADSMSSALVPTSTLDSSNLIFTYRRTDLSMTEPGIGINVEYGSNLNGWHTAVNGTDGVAITVTNDGFDTGVDKVEVSIPRSLAVGFSLFARLNVVIP